MFFLYFLNYVSKRKRTSHFVVTCKGPYRFMFLCKVKELDESLFVVSAAYEPVYFPDVSWLNNVVIICCLVGYSSSWVLYAKNV